MKTIRLDTDFVTTVFTTDWHLSDQPPGMRNAGYREEIMAKVEFVRDLTVKLNGVGLFGGDMFHQKDPKARGNSFSMITRLQNALTSFPQGTLYGVHGNHDLWMDRVDSIPHQPIGPLIASGALTDLSTGSVIFENRDGTVRVQVDAYPFADDLTTLDRVLNAAPREPNVQYRIVLMHAYGDPGTIVTMHGVPKIGFNQMADCDYDVALWGHDHSRTKTITVGNCTHVRLGSLSRASLAEDEVDRPVSAAVIKFKPGGMAYKEVEIPTKPLEIAFTAAHKPVERVRKTDEVSDYFNQMDLAVASIESTDPREVMAQLCPDDPAVLDRAVQLCGL